MVSVLVPVPPLRFTVTVNVVLPEPASELGLKFDDARDGIPLTLKFTVPVKLLTGVIVTV